MDFGDYYRFLSGEPALLRAAADFNRPAGGPAVPRFRPMAAWPGWRAFFPGPGGELWDFRDEKRRLALVEAETFRRLCLYWGAAVLAEDVAQAIDSRTVAGLKSALGPELYGFALGRGRFCLGSGRRLHRPEKAGPASLAQADLLEIGLSAVSACAQDWPAELRTQAEIRFGVRLAEPGPPLGPAEVTWRWLKKILLEVAPQWRPCFA
jgi:hypothetical protein